MPAFHNTIHLQGRELADAVSQAQAQKNAILEFLKMNAEIKFTPREIHKAFPSYELTSVRRCLTDLTEEGYLHNTKATGEKKMEHKGRPNYLWYYPKTNKPKHCNETTETSESLQPLIPLSVGIQGDLFASLI